PRTLAVPGRKQHRDRRVAPTDRVAELDAVHSAGHHDVGEDKIYVRIGVDELQRFVRVGDLLDHVPELLEVNGRHFGNLRAVFDHEDRTRAAGGRPRFRAYGRGGR